MYQKRSKDPWRHLSSDRKCLSLHAPSLLLPKASSPGLLSRYVKELSDRMMRVRTACGPKVMSESPI